MQSFLRRHPLQIFCSKAHREAWDRRNDTRGRRLITPTIVARVTRDGTRGDIETGKRASADKHIMIQQWIEEDKAAGRMPWPDFLARRYQAGFEPLT